ncbi:hypothetical protein HPP92_002773 [Vanilla planifolia]|uniref:Uncharacterized protein n=1 Tax=Vanilla planifolia TaxID=51239 RepID=A0A835S2E0_VANPL|nr:hypothetical protein HPP92_002773 [Vanilla planifolia]
MLFAQASSAISNGYLESITVLSLFCSHQSHNELQVPFLRRQEHWHKPLLRKGHLCKTQVKYARPPGVISITLAAAARFGWNADQPTPVAQWTTASYFFPRGSSRRRPPRTCSRGPRRRPGCGRGRRFGRRTLPSRGRRRAWRAGLRSG